MNSQTDQQLLAEYADDRSESAFAELVRRHIDFVHSAALRLVRDAHLAEDVTQAVFVALAQNARHLTGRPALAGWLHRTAQNLAANIVRSDVRRRAREQQLAAMNDFHCPDSGPIWADLAPHLDSALSDLNEADREALLMRYFEQKSAREIAQVLKVSDGAAQKRVNRAVDRLRECFAQRGVAVGSAGLAALLSANAVQAAPPALAFTISSAVVSLAGASAQTSTTFASAKIIAMTTLQKTILAAALATAIGTAIYATRHAPNRRLTPQALAQSTPPPSSSAAAAPVDRQPPTPRRRITVPPAIPPAPISALAKKSAAVAFPDTRIYQLLKQKQPRLTPAQVGPYLEANGRSAASLLAAYRTTTDPGLLTEAMTKYPTDPQVSFEAVIQKDISPEERRRRLDSFMKADPENSLASYLSALDHFKAGEPEATIKDLVAAAGKTQFQDYAKDRKQTDEEAYLAAGYPPGESKLMGNTFVIEPQLADFRQLGRYLIGLADNYDKSADASSRQNALQMTVDLGKRFGDQASGGPLMIQLVGISIERMALEVMDPASPYGAAGETVRERLDQLLARKESIHVLTAQADPIWERLSDRDWISYYNQVASIGEEEALKWMVANAGRN
jgi:RNA polymerase sigma factor (sigma-70 family)